mmetsp:Transcript_34087/g.101275  ORF Transcript_34087/g.101275 Transcript_34087/m.101275 type:complete len:189 (-) Transcript_34087:126-692(-)
MARPGRSSRARGAASALLCLALFCGGLAPSFSSLTGLRGSPRQTSRLTLRATLYKALAKVNVRVGPDTTAPSLADGVSAKLQSGEWVAQIEEGQVFDVEEVRQSAEQTYLKLAGQDGWVFTRGITGKWAGKDIIVAISEKDAAEAKAQGFVEGVERRLFRDESDRFAVIFLGVIIVITVFINIFVLTQ